MAYVSRGIGGRGKVLISDGFRYQRNKSFVSTISWRCHRKDCRALLSTRLFDVDEPNAVIRVLKLVTVESDFSADVSTVESPDGKLAVPLDGEQFNSFSIQRKVCKISVHSSVNVAWGRSSEGFELNTERPAAPKSIRRLNNDWDKVEIAVSDSNWSRVKAVKSDNDWNRAKEVLKKATGPSCMSSSNDHFKNLSHDLKLKSISCEGAFDLTQSDDDDASDLPLIASADSNFVPVVESSISPVAHCLSPYQHEVSSISDDSADSILTLCLSENSDVQAKHSDTDEDIDISSSTSQIAPEMVAPSTDQKQKRSIYRKWTEADLYQLTTPEKTSGKSSDTETAADSGKKKRKKFVKGGLAEKLNRLMMREKSSLTCWNHRKRQQQKTGSNRCLEVKVDCLTSYCGLSVGTACKLPSVEPNFNTLNGSGSLGVIFTNSTASRYKIKARSCVRIHPPWQTLKMIPSSNVVLCTNYCEPLSSAGLHCTEVSKDTAENEACTSPPLVAETSCNWRTVGVWSCLCQTDTSLSVKSCTGHQSASISLPGVHKKPTGGRQSSEALLHTESGFCESPTSRVLPSQSILESIDRKGGCVAVDVEFCAVVQRTFKRCVKHVLSHDREVEQSVLLQDMCGFLCELIVPKDYANSPSWSSMVSSGIGNMWLFTGLRVGPRLTRSRHCRLFSVIDSVWRKDAVFTTSSIDSQSEEFNSMGNASLAPEPLPPSFCYLLYAISSTESVCKKWESDVLPKVYTPAIYSDSIHSVVRDINKSRVSFSARLFYIHQMTSNGVRLLFVSEPSCQHNETFVYATIHSTCDAYIPTKLGDILIFTDVFLQNGNLYFDEYSRADVSDLYDCQKKITLRLNNLCILSDVFSLVSVSGCIVGVDKSTALIWLECDTCGSDHLKSSSLGKSLQCGLCGHHVITPITRMSLDVFVSVGDLFACVKLLEPTIESLLPASRSTKVFDVQSILGHCFCAMLCLVTAAYPGRERDVISVSRDSVHYELDEIALN